jgi:hypothetical protein
LIFCLRLRIFTPVLKSRVASSPDSFKDARETPSGVFGVHKVEAILFSRKNHRMRRSWAASSVTFAFRIQT